jgi:hypothetical protein
MGVKKYLRDDAVVPVRGIEERHRCRGRKATERMHILYRAIMGPWILCVSDASCGMIPLKGFRHVCLFVTLHDSPPCPDLKRIGVTVDDDHGCRLSVEFRFLA